MKFNVIITGKAMSRDFFFPMTQVRVVDVPDTELNDKVENDLQRIFYYGQNDFQPANVPSVSVGDVVIYHGEFYRVQPIGWMKLEPVKGETK